MCAPKNLKPIPVSLKLAPTLARRVNQLREARDLTVKQLAKLAQFEPRRVEDIESGLETWLSATDRQMLAQALRVDARLLQEVETRICADSVPESLASSNSVVLELTDKILKGERDLACPDCGSALKASVQEGFDIEGAPLRLAKAFCAKCPFVLR